METNETEFQKDFKKAEEAWGLHSGDSTPDTVWVQAEARTGSNYQVMVTAIPPLARGRIGGTHLVSVLQPWQTCYPIHGLNGLYPDYVLEKYKNPARDRRDVHGGDLAAITMTINHAIAKFEEWTATAVREEGAQ